MTATISAVELKIGSRIRLSRAIGMRTHDGPLRAETGTLATVDQVNADGSVCAWLDTPGYNVPIDQDGYEPLDEVWSEEQRAILRILRKRNGEATLVDLDRELRLLLADVPAKRLPRYWALKPMHVLGRMGLLEQDYDWPQRSYDNGLYRLTMLGASAAAVLLAA